MQAYLIIAVITPLMSWSTRSSHSIMELEYWKQSQHYAGSLINMIIFMGK